MAEILPCPFCGNVPSFEGDSSEWRDDCRYVQLSLVCCATMTECIGWKKARDLTPAERETALRAALTAAWNKRAETLLPAPTVGTATVMAVLATQYMKDRK